METTGSTLVDDQEWRKYDTRGHTNKKDHGNYRINLGG